VIRILGIDPGSRVTGYGIVESQAADYYYIASGCIRTKADTFPARIHEIFCGISEIATQYRPNEVAIEDVFVQHNVASALKLGQARGAAICGAAQYTEAIYEYTPTQIKQAVVGKGHATKPQIQHMVRAILQLDIAPTSDAADALAVAMCHAQTIRFSRKLATSQRLQKA